MKRINYEEFVKVRQASTDLQDAVKKLGKNAETVSRVAQNMRKHGVPLKKMRRGIHIDWEALAELAKSTPKK